MTDLPLMLALADVTDISFLVFYSLGYIVYINPWLSIQLVFLLCFLVTYYKSNKKPLTILRILDLRHKSPVYTFIATSLGGILPLRIYKQTKNFRSIFQNLVANSLRTSYYFWFASRAFGYIASLTTLFIGLTSIYTLVLIAIEDGSGASNVGIAIVYSIQIIEATQWALR